MRRLVSGIVGLSTLLAGCATINQDDSSRLKIIKNRNELICGVSGKIPGFSFMKSEPNAGSIKSNSLVNISLFIYI